MTKQSTTVIAKRDCRVIATASTTYLPQPRHGELPDPFTVNVGFVDSCVNLSAGCTISILNL